MDDLDGDGYFDLVAAADSVCCFDLSSSADYETSKAMDWPMFRNDRTRCGCYYKRIIADAGDIDEIVPSVTALRSIYPNPFNPVTRIAFDIGNRARVNITVYNASGRRICVLKDGVMDAGRHEVVWRGISDNGSAAASGIYFCRPVSDDVVQTKKMVLMRSIR